MIDYMPSPKMYVWYAEMRAIRQEAAAYAIQNAFKAWRRRRAAAAKDGSKSSGKQSAAKPGNAKRRGGKKQ
jgi:hypothetical protein